MSATLTLPVSRTNPLDTLYACSHEDFAEEVAENLKWYWNGDRPHAYEPDYGREPLLERLDVCIDSRKFEALPVEARVEVECAGNGEEWVFAMHLRLVRKYKESPLVVYEIDDAIATKVWPCKEERGAR